MNVRILHLAEGARQARGITVIIDVFRAFTLEAYLFDQGAEKIYTVADEKTAYRLKEEHPEYILIGERHGKILPGFDYGNSPSSVRGMDFTGRTFVHTTSNGTQGIANAVGADEILTGSLVNASATARYISARHPEEVSLVCMGWEGRDTEEDVLCAEYLKSLLEEKPMKDIVKRADDLRYTEGKKFFDPAQQDAFPQGDFAMCVKPDIFDFVIVNQKENGLSTDRRKDLHA